MRAFTLVLALAPALAAAAGPMPLAPRALSGGESRFIELAAKGGVPGYRAVAPGRGFAFDERGLEVRALAVDSAKAAGPVLRYSFADGATVAPAGLKRSPTVYHWFVGEPSQWATGLRSFGAIAYRGVWPGVDAVFAGDAAGFKYQFETAPGADITRVAFLVEGAQAARVTESGALELSVAGETLTDEAPLAFQPAGGGHDVIAARYVLERVGESAWRVGFAVGAYDKSRPLLIDPAWTAFSGLVGGNAADQVYAVARDAGGSSYACGLTASSNLVSIPAGSTPKGGVDAFLARFDSAGVPRVVAYVGGSGYDVCTGIAVDGAGRIYLAGGTTSTNFPAVRTDASLRLRRTKGADRDAFVMRLAADGATIEYSGFIGGSEDDQANAIAVDSLARAYVTGYTTCTAQAAAGCVTAGTAFPAFVGPDLSHGGDAAGGLGLDAFVARVDASGDTLEYAGFIGGDGGAEAGHGIAVGPDFAAVVAGETNASAGLPAAAGFRTAVNSRATDAGDGFAAKVAPAGGSLAWFTLLTGTAPAAGETGIDRALAVVVEGDGSVIVAGETDSVNFPADNAGARTGSGPQVIRRGGMDGFVLRLDATGAAVTAATYIGGTGFDSVEGVASDGTTLFAAGTTTVASSFPTAATTGLGFSIAPKGGQDGFVARIVRATPAAFSYSGFLGTASSEAIHAAAATGNGIAVVGGTTTTAGTAGLANPVGTALAGSSAATNGLLIRLDPTGPPSTLALSGTPQVAVVGAGFALALAITVRDADNNPIAGADVAFGTPASGPSAVLSAGPVVTTNASGVASVTATANLVAGGPYAVTAQVGALSTSFSLTNVVPAALRTRGDFNGDGRADILYRNNVTGQVYRLFANGLSLGGGAAAYMEPNTAWKVVGHADFNGDGVADLLWRNDATGAVYLLSFGGNGLPLGGASVVVEPDLAWKIVHTPDLDGDGRADILYWNSSTGQVYAMLMNGPSIVTQGAVFAEPNTAWKIAAVGDFAGSGKQNQLLWRNSTTGQVYLMTVSFSGGAFGQTGQLVYTEPNTAWKILAAADFNGDGKSDILWRNDATGMVYMMLMNGGSIASQGIVYTEPDTAWKIVAQGDYDGNGRADLLWRNDTTGAVYMMLMNGLAIGSQGLVYTEANTAWRILGPWEYGQ